MFWGGTKEFPPLSCCSAISPSGTLADGLLSLACEPSRDHTTVASGPLTPRGDGCGVCEPRTPAHRMALQLCSVGTAFWRRSNTLSAGGNRYFCSTNELGFIDSELREMRREISNRSRVYSEGRSPVGTGQRGKPGHSLNSSLHAPERLLLSLASWMTTQAQPLSRVSQLGSGAPGLHLGPGTPEPRHLSYTRQGRAS